MSAPNDDDDMVQMASDNIDEVIEETRNIYEDMALTASENITHDGRKELWIGDTGASTHMTNDLRGMFDYVRHNDKYIKVGNGNKIEIKLTGKKKCYYNNKEIVLHNVHYIPELKCNLFSILTSLSKGWKINNKGVNLSLVKGDIHLKFDKIIKCPTGQLIGVKLSPKTIKIIDQALINRSEQTRMTYNDAHQKLSHSNKNDVIATAKMYNWVITTPEQTCEHCAMAKIRQTNIKKEGRTITTRAGERLFFDISSVNATSLGGSNYWNLIIDHHTNFKWPIFLKQKSDLAKKAMPLIKWLHLNNKEVKFIRCDNAGENKTLEQECLNQGFNIQFEYTPPGSPQYNGTVERAFPTIYGKMRACFNAAGIPKEKQKLIWTECANYIYDTENIIVKGGKTTSPHRLMNNNEARFTQFWKYGRDKRHKEEYQS